MGCSQSSSKREVYSNTILPQETRTASNRQPNFTPKITGKRRTKRSQNQQKKGNHKEPSKNKCKINERKNSKDNKTKGSFFKKIKKNWQTFSETHQEKKREG